MHPPPGVLAPPISIILELSADTTNPAQERNSRAGSELGIQTSSRRSRIAWCVSLRRLQTSPPMCDAHQLAPRFSKCIELLVQEKHRHPFHTLSAQTGPLLPVKRSPIGFMTPRMYMDMRICAYKRQGLQIAPCIAEPVLPPAALQLQEFFCAQSASPPRRRRGEEHLFGWLPRCSGLEFKSSL